MDKAVVASKSPMFVDVEQGKSYFWCACGLSKSQPLCDGSHASTDIRPVMYSAEKTGMVSFCGCKQTKNAPLCDGSHGSLE